MRLVDGQKRMQTDGQRAEGLKKGQKGRSERRTNGLTLRRTEGLTGKRTVAWQNG